MTLCFITLLAWLLLTMVATSMRKLEDGQKLKPR
jgi:hypothetical protein